MKLVPPASGDRRQFTQADAVWRELFKAVQCSGKDRTIDHVPAGGSKWRAT